MWYESLDHTLKLYSFAAANIFLLDNGNIKLTGFKTAADLTIKTDRLNAYVGTSLWMAPEVIAQEAYDTKVSSKV